LEGTLGVFFKKNIASSKIPSIALYGCFQNEHHYNPYCRPIYTGTFSLANNQTILLLQSTFKNALCLFYDKPSTFSLPQKTTFL
ncbi:hypothetical protein, partial [Lacinutrix sp. MEBiC02595]